MRSITLRKMFNGEENVISTLIAEVFDEFIALGYSAEGINEFKKYIDPKFILFRKENGNIFIVAVDEDKIIGVIEMRDLSHISLFFVDKKYHGKGIGKTLIERMIEKCKSIDPSIKVVSVNSSPYAVKIYEKLGFKQIKEEQIKNGLRFVPMELLLNI